LCFERLQRQMDIKTQFHYTIYGKPPQRNGCYEWEKDLFASAHLEKVRSAIAG